jgi:hypothetical protein
VIERLFSFFGTVVNPPALFFWWKCGWAELSQGSDMEPAENIDQPAGQKLEKDGKG